MLHSLVSTVTTHNGNIIQELQYLGAMLDRTAATIVLLTRANGSYEYMGDTRKVNICGQIF
jgi:hypothetical protein